MLKSYLKMFLHLKKMQNKLKAEQSSIIFYFQNFVHCTDAVNTRYSATF